MSSTTDRRFPAATPDLIERIQCTLGDLVARHSAAALARVVEFVKINTSGSWPRLPPLQAPQRFYFPGLADRPWYEASDFSELKNVVAKLEAEFPAIRDEYVRTVRRQDLLSYEEQIPEARQMREASGETGTLLPADRWGTFSIRIGGKRDEANCSRCPHTAAVADSIKDSLGGDGAVFFSVVGARSRIPPHHDTQNTRLTIHLGLVIPPGCGLRVANETRHWQEGRCLIFEDTFEHEAWNHSEQPRVILMLDVWHPGLTAIERQALDALRVTFQAASAGN